MVDRRRGNREPYLLTLAYPSVQLAGKMNLGEKSGGCSLLGNARDMGDLAAPGSLGTCLKAADLKKSGCLAGQPYVGFTIPTTKCDHKVPIVYLKKLAAISSRLDTVKACFSPRGYRADYRVLRLSECSGSGRSSSWEGARPAPGFDVGGLQIWSPVLAPRSRVT